MPRRHIDRRDAGRHLLLAGTFIAVSLLAGCNNLVTGNSARAADRHAPETHTLRISFYYLALESDYRAGNNAAFRNIRGHVLYQASREFVEAASIEGSAKLNNGQILNYRSRVGKEVRWMRVDAPYGIGSTGCALVPMRSAAVDPEVIRVGSKLLIAETRGIRLPDGSLHDGIWEAVDIGTSIKGKRIDLFTGEGIGSMEVPRGSGLNHLQMVTAKVIGQVDNCRS
ncbi:MAG: 3D domain-containing protein [Alphaproteobacteria bacterium]